VSKETLVSAHGYNILVFKRILYILKVMKKKIEYGIYH